MIWRKWILTVQCHTMYEPLLDNRLPKFVEYTARRLPKCRPVIHSNGDFLTLETFRQYIECGLYIFRITQHDSRMPTNLQQILDEASETERKHIDIQFSNAMYLVNLIPTFKLPAKPLEVACDWPLTTLVITMGGDVVRADVFRRSKRQFQCESLSRRWTHVSGDGVLALARSS